MNEELIKRIESQLELFNEFDDMNARSWGYEEGILISGNEAKLFTLLLKEKNKST